MLEGRAVPIYPDLNIFILFMDTEEIPVASAKAHITRAHYQTVATSGNHAVIVDEPASLEGTDTGMNPFGLLLSSLGSCTAITLRMYVDRKMWIVDDIYVGLEAFQQDGVYNIESKLTFKGDLTGEQTDRLMQIAKACPIHKLLSGSVSIKTKLG
jgi:putative redox protein